MPHPLRLEVFETPETLDGPALLMPEELEELRLNAYERGYVAGWEDGTRQSATDKDLRRAAVERTAEQLAFSYHEARGHVLKALEPLFTAIAEAVLPRLARAAVVPLTLEQLMPLAHAAAETPVILRVAEGRRDDFVEAFEGLVLPPLEIVESADLAEGQAEFDVDAAETRVDLTRVAETIGQAIEAFYQTQNEERHRA